MNGYSKMRKISIPKSRSIDFSDLYTPLHQTHKPISDHHHSSKIQDRVVQIHNIKNPTTHEEDGNGEIFGVILSRSCSVSSASSHGCSLKSDHHHHHHQKQINSSGQVLESAVRRAFSMRRSSSVSSEGYCKIHRQCDPVVADDHGNGLMHARRSKKRRGKILKACRRLLGF